MCTHSMFHALREAYINHLTTATLIYVGIATTAVEVQLAIL